MFPQAGLKAGQFKARPHKDTPTVSRTHVSRYRESVLVARSPTGSKTMLQTTRIGEDEDTDSGSTSTSGDDDGDDDRELDRVVKARSIIRVGGGHVAKEGKESVPTRNNAGALAKDREQGRRFGKGIVASYREFPVSPFDSIFNSCRLRTGCGASHDRSKETLRNGIQAYSTSIQDPRTLEASTGICPCQIET